MKANRKTGWVALAIALAAVSQVPRFLRADSPAPIAATTSEPSLADLASAAVSADAAISKPAIEKLRAAGPAGLNALMAANEPAITAHRVGAAVSRPGAADPQWAHVITALDSVAAQRNAYASGLYWYTDLSAAEAAAKASGKPILSLRLLGNLNDEYSCANSRFFRTVLYANNEVARHLRDHFILHWQSVRPVPVITIDFGDGRIIRRTITGNSIHYVLTADGQVVDGIPGLYGAKAFLRQLGEAEKELKDLAALKSGDQTSALQRWHSEALYNIDKVFTSDRTSLSVTVNMLTVPALFSPGFPGQANSSINQAGAPGADIAARRAISKSSVESPLVNQVQITAPGRAAGTDIKPALQPKNVEDLTDTDWSRIAALHADDAVLDDGSRSLMAVKTIDAATATRLTMSKSLVESPLVRMMRNFQRSIAEDTVRNEYLLHSQIHRWLSDPSQAALAGDVTLLNKRVYAELFLTPDSDPWLGLVPADTYSALDDGGICH